MIITILTQFRVQLASKRVRERERKNERQLPVSSLTSDGADAAWDRCGYSVCLTPEYLYSQTIDFDLNCPLWQAILS